MLQNVCENCVEIGRREATSAPYVDYLGILIDKSKCDKPKTLRTPENVAAVAEGVREVPSTSIHRRH